MLKLISKDEIELGSLEKGSFIVVKWIDASEIKASLPEHVSNPEITCKDWGIYLGCSGRKKKLIILGKDVVEIHNEWGAARIPLELIEEIYQILPREEMLKAIKEIQVLGRKVHLRKKQRKEERIVVKTT